MVNRILLLSNPRLMIHQSGVKGLSAFANKESSAMLNEFGKMEVVSLLVVLSYLET